MDRHGYRRVRRIGKGAFGAAVLVEDMAGRQLVVKQVNTSHLSEDDRQAAAQEAKLLSRFDHPNVINLMTSFFAAGTLHIVMDFAEDGDLGSLLKERVAQGDGLLPEDAVLGYFVQLCLAMQHVHEHKVLHRDLKPRNIFLTNRRRHLKVGDFG